MIPTAALLLYVHKKSPQIAIADLRTFLYTSVGDIYGEQLTKKKTPATGSL